MHPLLSIIIPTIPGREKWAARTSAAYEERTARPFELIILLDESGNGCGPIWQRGGELAKGKYIFMAADDLEPRALDWEEHAIATCDAGALPAPVIYYPDGRLQSCGEHWEALDEDGAETMFTRAPFMNRAQWEIAQPMLATHYFTDNWVSWRCWQHDIPTLVTYGFDLVHHFANEGRNEERVFDDARVFYDLTGEDPYGWIT